MKNRNKVECKLKQVQKHDCGLFICSTNEADKNIALNWNLLLS